MQARDVMTREVVTVGPGTSDRYAAEIMAEQGFAAVPVDQLVGHAVLYRAPCPVAVVPLSGSSR